MKSMVKRQLGLFKTNVTLLPMLSSIQSNKAFVQVVALLCKLESSNFEDLPLRKVRNDAAASGGSKEPCLSTGYRHAAASVSTRRLMTSSSTQHQTSRDISPGTDAWSGELQCRT